VIDWDPAASVVVLKVATPLAFSGPVPRLVDPSRKVTVPVGTPLPDWGVTVAVNVTLWPAVTCVADAVKAVFVATPVGAAVTVTLTAAETEPAFLLSPL
jgi:hypothetical protein